MESALTSICLNKSLQILAITTAVAGTLIVAPQNGAVRSGQEVELHCKTDNEVKLKWLRQRPGYPNEEYEQIYSGYYFQTHADRVYDITKSADGDYMLSFNASVETAQRYRCWEPRSTEAKSADLIVLESDPNCDTVLDGYYANVTCAIVFHGNWAPTMIWTQCNNETIITSDVSNFTSSNGRLSSALAVRRNGNNSESCYRLTTMFREGDRPQGTTANNTPSYNHSICFKHPDWSNTSDCKEDLKDNRTTISLTEIEENYISVEVISDIAGIAALIGVPGVAFCCYCRYFRRSVARTMTLPAMTLTEHLFQGQREQPKKPKHISGIACYREKSRISLNGRQSTSV